MATINDFLRPAQVPCVAKMMAGLNLKAKYGNTINSNKNSCLLQTYCNSPEKNGRSSVASTA